LFTRILHARDRCRLDVRDDLSLLLLRLSHGSLACGDHDLQIPVGPPGEVVEPFARQREQQAAVQVPPVLVGEGADPALVHPALSERGLFGNAHRVKEIETSKGAPRLSTQEGTQVESIGCPIAVS
jgi:hypothetical protein